MLVCTLAGVTLSASLVSLLGCGSDGSASAPAAQATGLVSVAGKLISRDGKPWIPHAFQQVAFVAPPGYINTGNAMPIFVTAAAAYQATDYGLMVLQGADCVRIQFAQTGVDPSGAYPSPTFTANVIAAAKAARAAGLTVILSDQDEQQTGQLDQAPEPGLPEMHTQGAWMNLLKSAAWIGQDTGIMLEIYNEPFIKPKEIEGVPSGSDWTQWQSAMNSLISTIRGTGSRNVLIVDGLEHGEELTNADMYPLMDMVSPVIYGSHPYAHNYQDQNAAGTDANGNVVPETGWNVKFGNFAASYPVFVTEWGNGYYCDNITGTSDVKFLQYLQGLGVGLVATTWDWAGPNFGSIRVNFPTNTTITSFPAAGTPICHVPPPTTADPAPAPVIDDGVGPGQLVQTWFTTGTPSVVLE